MFVVVAAVVAEVVVAVVTSPTALAAQSASATDTTPTIPRLLPLAAESAATLARGSLRIAVGGTHAAARDRYVDGKLEGLGGPFSAAAFGPSRFSLLGSIEAEARALGLPEFAASLGSARLDARQRLFVTPLAVSYGLTDRLSLSVSTSLVRTKAEALFRLDGYGGLATMGRNPIELGTGVAAANAAVIGAHVGAAADLLAARDGCVANAAASPDCPTILAELAQVDALIGLSSAFATGLESFYGTSVGAHAPYVPLAGSAAEDALLARVDSMRVAFERYGVTSMPSGSGLPLGAQAPLSAEDLAHLVRDPVGGFGAKAIDQAGLIALGDVQFAATLRVHDGLRCRGDSGCVSPARGVRQSLRVGYSLSTGARRRADRFLDQGTGEGFDAISFTSLTDVALTSWLSASATIGLTTFVGADVRLRVPSTAAPVFLESWREAIVPVSPGMRIELGISPRVRINESFVAGLDWQWRQQASSRHGISTTVTDPRGATVPLEGGALDAMSAWSEQRAGLSATYSLLPAVARGLRRLPIDIAFTHAQTLFGHSGIVVKRWEDRLLVRYYARFLGR